MSLLNLTFFIVALYGTGLRYERSKIGRLGIFVNRLKKVASILFASLIYLIEEIQNVFFFYKKSKKIGILAEKQNIFENLSSEQKEEVKKFYNAKIEELDKAQKLLCRETTIQVALQLTLILYQEILIKLSFLRKVFIKNKISNFLYFSYQLKLFN